MLYEDGIEIFSEALRPTRFSRNLVEDADGVREETDDEFRARVVARLKDRTPPTLLDVIFSEAACLIYPPMALWGETKPGIGFVVHAQGGAADVLERRINERVQVCERVQVFRH